MQKCYRHFKTLLLHWMLCFRVSSAHLFHKDLDAVNINGRNQKIKTSILQHNTRVDTLCISLNKNQGATMFLIFSLNLARQLIWEECRRWENWSWLDEEMGGDTFTTDRDAWRKFSTENTHTRISFDRRDLNGFETNPVICFLLNT